MDITNKIQLYVSTPEADMVRGYFKTCYVCKEKKGPNLNGKGWDHDCAVCPDCIEKIPYCVWCGEGCYCPDCVEELVSAPNTIMIQKFWRGFVARFPLD